MFNYLTKTYKMKLKHITTLKTISLKFFGRLQIFMLTYNKIK